MSQESLAELSLSGGPSEEDQLLLDGEEKEKEVELSTRKPAMVVLPEEMTAMQIDCGTFHTGICMYIIRTYIHIRICVYMYFACI